MEKLANAITNYYLKKNVIAGDKYDIYFYGFKLIIADIINYMIIITLGMILKKLPESIIFLISLCGLRQFTGGFHAKTFWLCRLSMVITFMGVLMAATFIENLKIEILLTVSINIISIIAIMILAPIENVNKRLSKAQRKSNKIKSIITSILLSTTSVMLTVGDIKIGVTIKQRANMVMLLHIAVCLSSINLN